MRRMRRSISLLLFCALLVLLLPACRKKAPAETQPVETLQESTVEMEVEYVTAQVNGIPAVLATRSRGDAVDVVGTFDEKHYVVKLDVGYGLVEKNLVRREGETDYEPWTGYAYRNAAVYDNYRLWGDPVRKLGSDAEVKVLDDLGWCVLVDLEGETGYMKQESLAKKAGNSGASDSGSNSNGGASGQDGGEISMQFSGKITLLSTIAPQEGTVSGKAKILADQTQIVLGYFDRGDRIPVLKQSAKDETLTVYLDGLYAEVSGVYVLAEGEKAYPSWEGQSTQILSVYSDYWMQGSPIDRLNANTTVMILYELENSYLVEVNGVTGYVAKEAVVPVEEESPEETEPAQTQPEKTDKPTKPDTPAATVPKQDNDTTAPTKPKEPKPTETTEPTEESGSAETTEPTEESNPTEATEPEEEPTEPTKPTEPTEPAAPPTEATKPSEEEKPGGGTNSGNTSPEWTPPIL